MEFKDILLRGVLAPAGMERFNDILSDKDADNVHAYLIEQSWIAYRAQQNSGAQQDSGAQQSAAARQ
jgi:quinohemoprotein ethanol dehydrogenase